MKPHDTYFLFRKFFSQVNNIQFFFIAGVHLKWWSTLKSAVFGSSSSLPLLVSEGGGLVCKSVGKADLLSNILTASSPGRLLICLPSIS